MSLQEMLITKEDMLVLIDDSTYSNLQGRLVFRQSDQVIFPSSTALVNMINQYLDSINGPQKTREFRSFAKEEEGKTNLKMDGVVSMKKNVDKGGKGSFLIKVQYRQNSTLQGTIKWIEEDKTVNFRSVLEMLKLIDDAVSQDEDDNITW